jgi:hypothetical protein
MRVAANNVNDLRVVHTGRPSSTNTSKRISQSHDLHTVLQNSHAKIFQLTT